MKKRYVLGGLAAIGMVALIVAASLTVSISAVAQIRDPYAVDMRKVYERHKAQFLAISARIYFADRCGALPDRAHAPMLVATLGNGLIDEAAQARAPLPNRLLLDEAERRGVAMATKPGACAYWHEHPEQVSALRKLGTALEGGR